MEFDPIYGSNGLKFEFTQRVGPGSPLFFYVNGALMGAEAKHKLPSEPDRHTALGLATSLENRLTTQINQVIEPMGYEVIALEVQHHRQKLIRIFIDFIQDKADTNTTIGIEDCVKVTHALDTPLETLAETEPLLASAYELEVSSPGVDRPLKQEKDFIRFKEKRVRIHTFRSLTANELENESYHSLYTKQKNFLGTLLGLSESAQTLKVLLRMEDVSKKLNPEIKIPFELISKANLEPVFDFNDNERKYES